MTGEVQWYWVAAAIVGVLSSARLTRLLVADAYPPSIRIRMWWDTVTKDGLWSKLAHCPWCASPYISAIILTWALLSHLHWTWWVVNGWLAGSYLAAMVVFHDEGRSE